VEPGQAHDPGSVRQRDRGAAGFAIVQGRQETGRVAGDEREILCAAASPRRLSGE
jgi:hypothetical protein